MAPVFILFIVFTIFTGATLGAVNRPSDASLGGGLSILSPRFSSALPKCGNAVWVIGPAPVHFGNLEHANRCRHPDRSGEQHRPRPSKSGWIRAGLAYLPIKRLRFGVSGKLNAEISMNLIKSLPPEHILVGVEAADKWDLMRQMLDCIIRNTPESHFCDYTPEQIFTQLCEREEVQSTGVGDGFALPHARIPGFQNLTVCLATLSQELDYDSIDGRPVRMACMVLTSAEEPGLALKIMSSLSSVIINEAHRAHLQSVTTREEAHAFLAAQHLGLEVVVYAEELMVKPHFTIYPETSISEVTKLMMLHNEPSTAVQDDEGNLVGEITSDLLFQYGMPDFFKQLQSVSFVRKFNPLEKFFANQAKMKAGDLMTKDYAEVDRNSTLIEVIFLLTVKQHTKVYVTEGGKLVGVIGRIAVLDRAINF